MCAQQTSECDKVNGRCFLLWEQRKFSFVLVVSLERFHREGGLEFGLEESLPSKGWVKAFEVAGQQERRTGRSVPCLGQMSAEGLRGRGGGEACLGLWG